MDSMKSAAFSPLSVRVRLTDLHGARVHLPALSLTSSPRSGISISLRKLDPQAKKQGKECRWSGRVVCIEARIHQQDRGAIKL